MIMPDISNAPAEAVSYTHLIVKGLCSFVVVGTEIDVPFSVDAVNFRRPDVMAAAAFFRGSPEHAVLCSGDTGHGF